MRSFSFPGRAVVGLVITLGWIAAAVASSLTGDVGTRPGMALFKPGETVPLVFTATGASGQTLTVTIQNALGTQVFSGQYAVTSASWTSTVSGYTGKLGFFRVYGQLTDGTTIAPVGSRSPLPAGSASFLTYAIVPDPAQRPVLSEERSFFGIQGGIRANVGTDVLAFLGVRWYSDDSWTWNALAPTHTQPLSYAANPGPRLNWATNGAGGAWTFYTFANLTKNGRPYGGSPDVYQPGTFAYNTGALEANYYPDWQDFCAHVAQNWPTVYPGRTKKYYEVTWEPIVDWGYKGSAEDLATMYSLAAAAMKAVDPAAKIMGPCVGINSIPSLDGNFDFFDAGLADSLDAFSAHTYMEQDVVQDADSFTDPELAGQPGLIATLKRHLLAYKGSELPMIGTEQGYRTRQNVAKELNQARRLIRSNLILLGEGWKINTAFFFADYLTTDDLDGNSYWDWGLFYNLDLGTSNGFAPNKVSPKPVAAAYAAMTFLVEGRKAVNNVNWLGNTVRGYVYESYANPNDVVLALWDFNGASSVTINAGVASVDVYDWMGNKTTTPTSSGSVTLSLSREPIYVKGVAASLWGSSRQETNVALGKTVTTSGNASASTPGSLAVDGDAWSYESRWLSPQNWAPEKWIEIDLGGAYPVHGVRFWTGDYLPGYRNNLYRDVLASYAIRRWDSATSTWVNIVSRTGNTRAAVDEVFTAVNTSKIRLYVGAWAAEQIKLYEIQVLANVAPTIVSGQYYRLKNRANNLYLSAIGGQNYDGGGVGLWNWYNSTTQYWQITSLGNGTYQLKNQANALYLSANGAQNYDGGAAGVWNWYSSATQCWYLEDAGGGYLRLKNQGVSGRYLSSVAGQTGDGSSVGLWNWSGATTQYWTVDQP